MANAEGMQDDIIRLVRQHFSVLSTPGLQEEIAAQAFLIELKPEQVLLEVGAEIPVIPLLIKGSLKVMRNDHEGHELLLYYIAPDETCAMTISSCLGNEPSQVRAVSEEKGLLLAIPAKFMDIWISKYPAWKAFVMKTFQLRFDQLLHTLDSVAFMKMDERLLDYLEKRRLASSSQVLQVTHQEIAYDLNCSREAVSRLLKQMEQEGRIRLGRNRIEVLNSRRDP